MDHPLENEQLKSLLGDLRQSVSDNIIQKPVKQTGLEFGCVRFGGHPDFAQGNKHPLVIASEWADKIPPSLSLRPSTSQRKQSQTRKRQILHIPAGGINLKKAGRQFVDSYILCFKRLRSPTKDVERMLFLNRLEPKYLVQFKECIGNPKT